jgi:hypothetical protein
LTFIADAIFDHGAHTTLQADSRRYRGWHYLEVSAQNFRGPSGTIAAVDSTSSLNDAEIELALPVTLTARQHSSLSGFDGCLHDCPPKAYVHSRLAAAVSFKRDGLRWPPAQVADRRSGIRNSFEFVYAIVYEPADRAFGGLNDRPALLAVLALIGSRRCRRHSDGKNRAQQSACPEYALVLPYHFLLLLGRFLPGRPS